VSELIADSARIGARPEAIWSILEDPAALARVLPGAESIESVGPGRFTGVLASKLQFLTIRADVTAEFRDADPPRHLRLEMDGRPRGLAGSFRVSIPFDLVELEDGVTQVTYSVDLTVTGRLAAFGAPLLRDTMRRQIDALVSNVELELAAR
jgi:carbon monoxide dehydrogenase subunit G